MAAWRSPPVPDLSVFEAFARLAVAAALGGVIGLDRELRDHDAGLRTHALVALGACLFTIVSAYGWSEWAQAGGVFRVDPGRVAAQVVTGVGFLGAGAIIVRGASVRGLTTAAAVWLVAAIGVAVAIGMYGEAAGATVLGLVSLRIVKLVENRALDDAGPERGALVVHFGTARPATVLAEVSRMTGAPRRIELAGDHALIELTLHDPPSEMLQAISDLDGVERVEWSS